MQDVHEKQEFQFLPKKIASMENVTSCVNDISILMSEKFLLIHTFRYYIIKVFFLLKLEALVAISVSENMSIRIYND